MMVSLFVFCFVFSLFISSSLSHSISSTKPNALTCPECEAIMGAIIPLLQKNATVDLIRDIAIPICSAIHPDCKGVDQCKELCTGVVNEHINEVLKIASTTLLAPATMCYILKSCTTLPPTPKPVPANQLIWSDITDYTNEKHFPAWKQTTGTGYFVHLTDIHLDILYSPSTPVVCGMPVCCRNASQGTGVASEWGEYTCDSSPSTFESVLKYIKTLSPPPDFILYTGDDPAHDIWMQTREKNIAAMRAVSAGFQTHLPNIPLVPSLGNHESYPVNQYEGPGFDSWLYTAATDIWSSWLSDDAKKTMGFGGFYTQRIHPGLRVISLHTTMFQNEDFWLIANLSDYGGQLPWLSTVLHDISLLSSPEKVIIIGHSPTSSWISPFKEQMETLLKKYQEIISGIFWGHSHYSRFVLHTDSADTPAYAISYVGGSLTPVSFSNPSFTSYTYNRAEVTTSAQLVENMSRNWFDINQVRDEKNIDTYWQTEQFNLLSNFSLTDTTPASYQTLGMTLLKQAQNNETSDELSAYRMNYYADAPNHSMTDLQLICEFLWHACP